MHNLRRFFYQNKNKIIKTILMIVFIIALIQLLNYLAKNKNEEGLTQVSKNTNTNTANTESGKALISNQSAISGKDVSKKQLTNATTTIGSFMEYCNKQDLENAYNLLTDDCKNQMFTSLEVFKQAYYNNVFNGQKKTYTVENWFGDTYKVKINEDILATGKNNEYSKQDYITVKEVNGKYLLNINNYIGYTEINQETTKDDITVKVVGKNEYNDYEEYTMKVTNNTENTILLDTVNNSETLYLEDDNGKKHPYYNHELTQSALTVEAGQTKDVTIKFYSGYTSNKKIKAIVFSNIISTNEQLSERIEFRAKV